MERLKTEYWPRAPLDEVAVHCPAGVCVQTTRGMFNDVIEILGLNDPDDPTNSRELEDDIDPLQACQVGTAFIDGNTVWNTVCANGTLEEPIYGGGIPAL